MAVMLVPITSGGRSGLVAVSRRLIHRMLSCVIGGLSSALFLRGAAFARSHMTVAWDHTIAPELPSRDL
jgi:hypothetical protein